MRNIFKSLLMAGTLSASMFVSTDIFAQVSSVNLSGSMSEGGNYPGFVLLDKTFNLTFEQQQNSQAIPVNSIRLTMSLPGQGVEFAATYPGAPTGWTYTKVSATSAYLVNTSVVIPAPDLSTPVVQQTFQVPVITVSPGTNGAASFGWGVTLAAFAPSSFSISNIGNTANTSSGTVVVNNSPLPVLFKDFTVTAEGCKAVLNWSTAVEKNNSHFEIERSQNGTEFRSIGSTNGAGTSFEVNSYTYVDEKPENLTNFYRIRQVDFDKKSTTSTIENAKFDCKVTGISVYPNPTSDVVYVKGLTDKGSIKVYNMVGQLVIDKKVENSLEGINMSSLAEGTYQIQVFSGDKSVFNTKLIKR